MDSPAAGIQRSRPRSHRKPLLPMNSPAEPRPRADPKPSKPDPVLLLRSPAHGTAADKENRLPTAAAAALEAGIGRVDTSLAEELGAVRRRRERLRLERERTERVLAERGRQLDRAMREVERRWEEQRRVELELRRLIGLPGLGSPCERPSRFQSLREREQKRSARFPVIKNEESEMNAKREGDAEPSGRRGETQGSGEESSPSVKS